jgi:hypothetical protein
MCIEWSGEFKVANKPSKTEIEVSIEASADVTVTRTVRVLHVDDDATIIIAVEDEHSHE